uniref:Secreted protein n=1 Tax=Panagrellus redivivus TaxID=6233 RepID=A0A7E4ZQD2_PANRE
MKFLQAALVILSLAVVLDTVAGYISNLPSFCNDDRLLIKDNSKCQWKKPGFVVTTRIQKPKSKRGRRASHLPDRFFK